MHEGNFHAKKTECQRELTFFKSKSAEVVKNVVPKVGIRSSKNYRRKKAVEELSRMRTPRGPEEKRRFENLVEKRTLESYRRKETGCNNV